MPRALGSGKRQLGAGASHRDSRHDNGLVGPGKRIAARKSLDASVSLPDRGSGPPPPPPATNGLANGTPPKTRPDDAATPSASCSSSGLDSRSSHPLRRGSLDTLGSDASAESYHSNMGVNFSILDAGHRHIDVNAMKNADVHRDSASSELVATVVRSLPIQDTVAILIILMHIPYISLTLVYLCFVSLTFVPPVANKAGWNINLGEIFDGNSHTPSLATVVCMDLFFFLIWIFLWPHIQDFMLDFAKPVIAITLGGGTSAKDGTSRGVTACFSWLMMHKLIRASKKYWPRVARHVPGGWRMPAAFSHSFDSTPATYDKRDSHGWVQSILAMHILAQGIVRYVREWYLRREKFSAMAAFGDPDAANPGGASVNATDSAHDASLGAHDAETGPTAPPHPAAMIKKRRKQGAQVRLQQPLWAALASTKIVALKEYELSGWGSAAVGSDQTGIHNFGSAPSFDEMPKQVWISYIGSEAVCFGTSHFPELRNEPPPSQTADGQETRPDGVDLSKPFYVKINNVLWQPTRVFPLNENDDGCDQGSRWSGDIYGLLPASQYVCEFVDVRTDQILFTTTILTVNRPLREHDPMPSGWDAKLANNKNRLKALRKEWKNRINALKKEIELLDNQLSSGNSDEKYKQKIRQQGTHKAQAERDAERLTEKLVAIDAASALAEHKGEVERIYSNEKTAFDAIQKQYTEHTLQLENEIKTRETEKLSLNSRRNKVAARIAKVENELANVVEDYTRDMIEADQRKQERVAWLEQVLAARIKYMERLSVAAAANDLRGERLRYLRDFSCRTYRSRASVPMDGSPAIVPEPGHHPSPFQASSPWNPSPSTSQNYPASPWAYAGEIQPPVGASQGLPSVGVVQRQPPIGTGQGLPSIGVVQGLPSVGVVQRQPPIGAGQGLPSVGVGEGQPPIGERLPPVSGPSRLTNWLTHPTAPRPPAPPSCCTKKRRRSSSMLSDVSGFTE